MRVFNGLALGFRNCELVPVCAKVAWDADCMFGRVDLVDSGIYGVLVQVKEMARRLFQMELKPSCHSKCLGPRVKAALSQLLSCNSVEQARSACEAAAWGTTYSRNACMWLVEDGALVALSKFMRVCSTNKSNASLLCSMLTTLANILSHDESRVPVAPALLAAMVPTISDLLQLFRCAHVQRSTRYTCFTV